MTSPRAFRSTAFYWAIALACLHPAYAQSERELRDRFCPTAAHGYAFPDGTRADCLTDTHAIDVDFSETWRGSIGRSLHSAWWTAELDPGTRKKAGIILVCRKNKDICTDHLIQLVRVVDSFGFPITIWDCDTDDADLGRCQVIDRP